MKLKNKLTGEIGLMCTTYDTPIIFVDCREDKTYNSLSELCEDWTDYKEEPYVIDMWEDDCIVDVSFGVELAGIERAKECGLWFETREEAVLAVRKLKAWKLLRDTGFRIIDWETDDKTIADGKIWFDLGGREMSCGEALKIQEIKDAMQLLFGGEE